MKFITLFNAKLSLKAAMTLLVLFSIPLQANWPTEDEAYAVAEELKLLVTAGTSVIGDLQPEINSGQLEASHTDSTHFLQDFLKKYAHATGSEMDTTVGGLLGKTRQEFLESYMSVIHNNNSVISTGGQDSFVPAYFRSEVLAEFNKRLNGRVKGYATNREDDLLNPDWSIEVLMDYSMFAYYIQDLLDKQEKETKVETVAGRVMGYYPMKLKQGCVSCHARQGLDQKVGEYGGALITEVSLEH